MRARSALQSNMARSKNLQYIHIYMGLCFLKHMASRKSVLTRPVLARTYGAGYEAIEGGCDSGRHVDQRCAGIYCLWRIRHRKRKERVISCRASKLRSERKLTAVSFVGASIPSAHRPSIL